MGHDAAHAAGGTGVLRHDGARIRFTARKTTLFVGQSSSHLVCEGPFRVSRNPMYVGVLVSLVGLTLCVGTLPLYMTVPTTFAVFNFFHIPLEERQRHGRIPD